MRKLVFTLERKADDDDRPSGRYCPICGRADAEGSRPWCLGCMRLSRLPYGQGIHCPDTGELLLRSNGQGRLIGIDLWEERAQEAKRKAGSQGWHLAAVIVAITGLVLLRGCLASL